MKELTVKLKSGEKVVFTEVDIQLVIIMIQTIITIADFDLSERLMVKDIEHKFNKLING